MTGIPPKKPRTHILDVPEDVQHRIMSKLPFISKINAGLVCKQWDLLLRAGTPTERHWIVEYNLDTLVSSKKLTTAGADANLWQLSTHITSWLAKRAAAIESVHISATLRSDQHGFGAKRDFLETLLSLAAGCLSNFENRLNLTICGQSPFTRPLLSDSAFLTALCPMVKSLSLSEPGVLISHAHFAAICKLSNLEELSLSAGWKQSEEGLQEVTSDFSKLLNLKVLNLHDHDTLENIPDSICYLQKIEHLQILGTKGGGLPNLTSTPNYKDLLVVDRSLQLEAGMTLEWSPVTHFSKDPLYLLDKLSMVMLMDCCLRCAPENLTAISALTSLDLSQNDFINPMEGQWWPTTLSGLTNLRELIIADCNIESLPSHLSALVQLKKLDVSGNQLRSLPNELSSLGNLTELLLSWNGLPTVPVSILSVLTTLHTVDLSVQFWEDAMFSISSPLLPLLHPGLVKLDLHQGQRLEPLSLFHVGRAVCELATRGRPVNTLLY